MGDTFTRIIELVAKDDVRISEHGYDELVEDGITIADILEGIGIGRVIEEYQQFPKGPSVLVLQFDRKGNPIHAVWGIPKGFDRPAVLVTAYRPDPARWDERFMERRK
ncbi:MAG: DUF4258 domain-containing protein [Methylocella sp.]